MRNGLKHMALRHQIYVQRYGTGVMKKIVATLNAVDRDLAARLQERLTRMQDGGIVTTAQLNALLESVRAMNAAAYQDMKKSLTKELQSFAEYESQFQAGMLDKATSTGANVTTPPPDLVKAAVVEDPIRGKLLSEWVDELSNSKYIRLRDSLRLGIVEGKTSQEMVRDIMGTKSSGYSDGIIETDRRGAEALVRTSVNYVVTAAKEAVFEENDDIVEGLEWVSTLDDRTCPLCAPLDGQDFDLDEGPRPPFHVNCRCTVVPNIKSDYQILPDGDRPAVNEDGAEEVPAGTTYESWLGDQSAAFQDETLGQTRGALFRRGDLSLKSFVNRSGDELTLDELRAKEPEAFSAAGLD